jgi:uncharacterized protein
VHYRRFGQTNLPLSVFSLGTMRALGNPATAVATLRHGVDLGINHIETAQSYGNSELYLAQALQAGLPRQNIYITTKVLPSADARQMTAAIDRSLARLGVNEIDCLAVHGLNTWEHLGWMLGTDEQPGALTALHAAITAGKVRYLGFSSHGSLELIQAAICSGQFAFVNLHYTLFQPRNLAAVALAAERDMGVFLISPADKGGLLYTPSDLLNQLCQPWSPLHLNYRFLLSDPRITTLSVGPANPTELDWPLAVADDIQPLSAAEQTVLAKLQAHLMAQLGPERCSQCYACLPCPAEIQIPEALRLRNLAVAYDMQAFGEYRYRMFENAGHWFPGNKGNRCTDCGDCLPRCPEQLDIPTLLRDTHTRLNGQPRPRLWESI